LDFGTGSVLVSAGVGGEFGSVAAYHDDGYTQLDDFNGYNRKEESGVEWRRMHIKLSHDITALK
jgi:hypothetical protein